VAEFHAMKIMLLILGVSICCATHAQDLIQPPDHGVYYRARDGWKKIEEIDMFGQTHKHAFKPDLEYTYRGATATLQLPDSRPVFYIRVQPEKKDTQSAAIRNLVIVRFDKAKDHRELEVVSGGLFASSMKTGANANSKQLLDVTVRSVSDLIWSLTPNEDLRPGEYMITSDSMARSGYDFGITKP
jgi:hypothetical protein